MALQLQRTNILLNNIINGGARFFTVSSAAAGKSFRNWYRGLWEPNVNKPPYDHFTQIGDPVLRSIAAPVPQEHLKSKEVELIIDKMVKVLHKFDCVGVAAPQIGVSLRIIVMEFHEKQLKKYSNEQSKTRQMKPLPLTIVINPIMKVTNYDKHKHPEGCMSVRGYTGEVERYDSVILTGYDRFGCETTVELTGWSARIAQHEMDHLDGKIYIDRMDRSTFACNCWEAVNDHAGRVEIPFYK